VPRCGATKSYGSRGKPDDSVSPSVSPSVPPSLCPSLCLPRSGRMGVVVLDPGTDVIRPLVLVNRTDNRKLIIIISCNNNYYCRCRERLSKVLVLGFLVWSLAVRDGPGSTPAGASKTGEVHAAGVLA
jgi:hypothetical protein